MEFRRWLHESSLPSVSQLRALVPRLVQVAQAEYDAWTQGEEDYLNGGGICQEIAQALCGVISEAGIDCTTVSASVGEQHVWVVACCEDGVYEVDIPPAYYETGGGYTWSKIPDVRFEPSDVVVRRISADPGDFERYTEMD